MTEQKHIPPVTPKNFVVRYKASVERAFDNAEVKFPSIEDDNWEKLMEALSAEANKLLVNFQQSPPSPTPETGEKDDNDKLPYHDQFLVWAKGITKGKNTTMSDLYDYWIANIHTQPHSPVQALTTDEEAAEIYAEEKYARTGEAKDIAATAFAAGCTRVRAQQGEIAKQLQEIRAAFQWTFDNMNTPHTSDHFNVPANGIAQIDRLLTLFSSQTKQP